MNISDIKVGQNLKHVKEQLANNENIRISVLPFYMQSDYLMIKNLETEEKIYVKTDENQIIDSIKYVVDDVTPVKRITRDNINEVLAEISQNVAKHEDES